MALTLARLAELTDCNLHGDGDVLIQGVAPLADAHSGSIAFLANRKYRKQLAETRASAVILCADDLPGCPVPALVCANPHLAYARVAALLHPSPTRPVGIHPSTVVDGAAYIDPLASIGPNCTIAAGVSVAAGAYVGPNCVLMEGVCVGADTSLVATVYLGPGVHIGARCLIHPGAVVGADGFGFADDAGRWVKVPQIGSVRIGDDVEIGACTTIDRGAIHDTIIADGVKLDNQIMVAHNVEIGAHTAIAACVGISGSTRIGAHCTLAGAVGVVGHIELTDNVHISGMSMVSRSIREPGVYTGSIPAMPHAEWRRNFARLKQLDEMVRRIKALEAASARSDDGDPSALDA